MRGIFFAASCLLRAGCFSKQVLGLAGNHGEGIVDLMSCAGSELGEGAQFLFAQTFRLGSLLLLQEGVKFIQVVFHLFEVWQALQTKVLGSQSQQVLEEGNLGRRPAEQDSRFNIRRRSGGCLGGIGSSNRRSQPDVESRGIREQPQSTAFMLDSLDGLSHDVEKLLFRAEADGQFGRELEVSNQRRQPSRKLPAPGQSASERRRVHLPAALLHDCRLASKVRIRQAARDGVAVHDGYAEPTERRHQAADPGQVGIACAVALRQVPGSRRVAQGRLMNRLDCRLMPIGPAGWLCF
jgi:hypothetical protein